MFAHAEVEETISHAEYHSPAAHVISGGVNGDLIYYNGLQFTRLPVGNPGQILGAPSGVPAWTNLRITVDDPVHGDMVYYSAVPGVNSFVSIPIGTNDQVLTVVAGVPAWVNPVSISSIQAQSATAFTVARANPDYALQINTSDPACVTGLEIRSGITGVGTLIQAISPAANSLLSINAKGTGSISLGNLSTGNILSFRTLDMQNNIITNIGNPATDFTATGGLNLAGVTNVQVGNALAFTVARANPDYAFQVDTAESASVTGIKITSHVAGGGVHLDAIGTLANTTLFISAKGNSQVIIGNLSTGSIELQRATNVAGAFAASGGTVNTLSSTEGRTQFFRTSTFSSAYTLWVGHDNTTDVADNSGYLNVDTGRYPWWTDTADVLRLPQGFNAAAASTVGGNLTVTGTISASNFTANPMTTAGDIIIGGASGVQTRLAIGASTQVLTVTGGVPVWASPASGGMTNPMTTAGDMIIGGVSGAPTRLAVGTNGHVLTLVTGVPTWTAIGGGGFVPGTGNLDMGNFLILNIGAAGTDFTAGGGLTLATGLTITTGGITMPAAAASLAMTGASAGIELGSRAGANTPYIDFHAIADADQDYDVRLIASGGIVDSPGQGLLTINGAVTISGPTGLTAFTVNAPTNMSACLMVATTNNHIHLLENNHTGALGIAIEAYHNSTDPAANDVIYRLLARANTSTAVKTSFGGIYHTISSPTNGAVASYWSFYASAVASGFVETLQVNPAGSSFLVGTVTVNNNVNLTSGDLILLNGQIGINTTTPGHLNPPTATFGDVFPLHVKRTGGAGSAYIVVDNPGIAGMMLNDSSQAADARLWAFESNGSIFNFSTYTDVGSVTPRLTLTRAGVLGITGSILFGGDTNLYKSAADTLKTDDAFIAGGIITGLSHITVNGDITAATGRVGIGSPPQAHIGLYVAGSILGTATTQYNILSDGILSSTATVSGYAGFFRLRTANASYTMATAATLLVATPIKGGGSSFITTAYGIQIEAQTAATTNNYGIRVFAPSGGSNVNRAIYVDGGGIELASGDLTCITGSIGIGAAPHTGHLLAEQIIDFSAGTAMIRQSGASILLAQNAVYTGAWTSVANLPIALLSIGSSSHTFFCNPAVGAATTFTPKAIFQITLDVSAVAGAALATDGHLRSPNNFRWMARNDANTANQIILQFDQLDRVLLGSDSSGAVVVSSGTPGSQVNLWAGGNSRVSVYNDGGVVVGAPTGGNKGPGTINAVAVYDDNTLLTDHVFEAGYDVLSISKMREFYEQNAHLPTIPGRKVWEDTGSFSLGKVATHLWETVEVQAIYIAELEARLTRLERVN